VSKPPPQATGRVDHFPTYLDHGVWMSESKSSQVKSNLNLTHPPRFCKAHKTDGFASGGAQVRLVHLPALSFDPVRPCGSPRRTSGAAG
jgi:hypothetical protein